MFLAIVMILSMVPIAAGAEATGADPGLDLLLSGYNLFAGKDLRRKTITQLVTPAGALALEELSQTIGFMHFSGGSETTYSYKSASSMERFAEKNGVDIKTVWGVGGSTEVSKGGFRLFGKQIIEPAFKATANYKFDKSTFKKDDSSFTTAYESFFASLEIRKELGKNHIDRKSVV